MNKYMKLNKLMYSLRTRSFNSYFPVFSSIVNQKLEVIALKLEVIAKMLHRVTKKNFFLLHGVIFFWFRVCYYQTVNAF